MSEGRILRDFIYLDTDWMYSLYSQVFEGVVERIAESYMNEHSSSNTQAGRLGAGQSSDTQVAEMSLLTENKLLHDHMYNQLEGGINAALWDSRSASADEPLRNITNSALVKVHGQAQIEDSAHVQVLFERYNDVGAAVAYPDLVEEKLEQILAMEDRVRNAKKGEREKLEGELAKLVDARPLAATRNLRLDEQSLYNLRLILDTFQPDLFELVITPGGPFESTAFRCVLDRRWVRLSADRLRALYSTTVGAQWTVVGQVTHLAERRASAPSQDVIAQITSELSALGVDAGENGANGATDEGATSGEVVPVEFSMRDRYRAMFESLREFEKHFMESGQRGEVIVRPLAVYQEMVIPIAVDDTDE